MKTPNFKPGDIALVVYPNLITGDSYNCGKVVRLIERWGPAGRLESGLYFIGRSPVASRLWLVEACGSLLQYNSLATGNPYMVPTGPMDERRLILFGNDSTLNEAEKVLELENA